ncbi:MAG: CSLREA domain-containing protein, partial [Candidatus Limnocylindrales bacterium]
MRRFSLALVLVSLAVVGGSSMAAVAAVPGPALAITTPERVARDRAFEITLRLPEGTAAVDGRVLFDTHAMELLGVAPLGGGVGLRPVEMRDGAAFGAYGLRSSTGATVLRLVFVASRAGRVQVRVVVDATAGRDGRRATVSGADRVATVGVGGGTTSIPSPQVTSRPDPVRAAGTVQELQPDGRFDKRDVDVARWAWEYARLKGTVCDASAGDANRDGCVDAVDVQATVAARSKSDQFTAPSSDQFTAPSLAAVIASTTYVVTSPTDTPDAATGNGVCADSLGVCTLRAAIMEANWTSGEDRIDFALPGLAPALIQLSGPLPLINSRSGGVIIDGYTQAGSRVNSATVGSNAIPGVEIRGNGFNAREVAFFITSSGNTIRGMLIHNAYRGIMVDHPNAFNNRIVGNFIGFTRTGANEVAMNYAVVLNTGAHDNIVGTPALADRNVIGNHSHAVEAYGPGTNANVIQNNVLCMRPTGMATAICNVGVDHNFGPKNELIGGTGLNEKNMIGATRLQGIEYSHGWNPAVGNGDTDPTYQINNNRSIGNWVGFRGDGSYDIAFRSGQNDQGTADNGNGINVYDGSNDNLVEGNYIASRFDGIQVMSQNAQRNTVRNNIIGESPLGQAAPLTGWGLKIRNGTRFDTL